MFVEFVILKAVAKSLSAVEQWKVKLCSKHFVSFSMCAMKHHNSYSFTRNIGQLIILKEPYHVQIAYTLHIRVLSTARALEELSFSWNDHLQRAVNGIVDTAGGFCFCRYLTSWYHNCVVGKLVLMNNEDIEQVI